MMKGLQRGDRVTDKLAGVGAEIKDMTKKEESLSKTTTTTDESRLRERHAKIL